MEVETAARKQLLSKAIITAQVGTRVYKFDLEDSLEGTGNGALVVRRAGGWTTPGMNSQEYPLLVVEAFFDMSRDVNGNPAKDDAEERVYAALREVDRVLHQKDREVRHWPEGDPDGLLVLGCFRGVEPSDVVDKHGVKAARTVYNVQCIHTG